MACKFLPNSIEIEYNNCLHNDKHGMIKIDPPPKVEKLKNNVEIYCIY
jgi:hypothetical protein